MHRLVYVSGHTGLEIELDGDSLFIGKALGIRGREWRYTLGNRSLRGITRNARECDVTVSATSLSELDNLRRILDADMFYNEPGTLVVDDKWKQRALATTFDPSDLFGNYAAGSLSLVLLDGAWWALSDVQQFRQRNEEEEAYEYLDYPHDFPFDYKASPERNSVDVDTLTENDIRLVIYGPITTPTVEIGGNAYTVDTQVDSDAYLVVDGREKTVTKVLSDGTRVNEFDNAVRGGGANSGSYIFQRIPAGGDIEVLWDKTFDFDLSWYVEEGEPPWSR